MLYRPGIGDGGAEVSDMCHIGPTYGMAAAVIWTEYSAPSLEADRAPRMFRSINSTSALSLGIWVSVPFVMVSR